ncbi:glycosyltransferase family 4 protein [Candidatus Omnitrophota bacterium]
MRVLHLTTHINVGGISQYIYSLLKEMNKELDYSAVVSSGGTYEKRLQECGTDIITLPIKTKNAFSPKIFFAIIPIVKILREKKIDLMHAHTRVTQVLAFFVSIITGIPFVSTWHGYYKNRIGRKLFPAWGKKIIAISDPVKDDLIHSFHLPEEKIRLIYNSIDMDRFESKVVGINSDEEKKKLNLDNAFPIIGTVARLVEDKGYPCLLNAFKVILKKHPAGKLLIVGEGKYKEQLKALINDLDIAQHVVVLGAVENVAIPLQTMDVFVLVPSLREGFGLSVIEAMTLKKPVVVSNIGGLVSIVEHKKRGLIIEADNEKALAESIIYLIENSDKRNEFIENAYLYVRQNFSIATMVKKVKKLYEECIK